MKQHYLPECYLNEFTNASGTFFVIDNDLLKTGRKTYIRQKTPAQICYLPDYYTLDMKLPPNYSNVENEDPLLIENSLFRRYENEYPSILSLIRKRTPLTHSQADLLMWALISLKLRNKYIRDEFSGEKHKKIINEIFDKDLIDAVYTAKKSFPHATEEEIITSINSIKNQATDDPEFIKMLHLTAIIDRERNPNSIINKIKQIFLNKEWMIYESDFSSLFVCTDNPGFCVDSNNIVHNTKFGDCTFIFPLTPLYCLVISDKKNDLSFFENAVKKTLIYRQANAQFINEINNASLINFTRYVIAQTSQTLNSLLASIILLNKSN